MPSWAKCSICFKSIKSVLIIGNHIGLSMWASITIIKLFNIIKKKE